MRVIRKFVQVLSDKSGFTKYEIQAVLYFLLLFTIGMLYALYQNRHVPEHVFSYTKQDSLYNAIITEVNAVKDTSTLMLHDSSGAPVQNKKAAPGTKIRINKAAEGELMLIPGIGRKTAEQICLLRRQGKLFKKPEDVLDIKGIGKKKLNKMIPFISFD